MFFGFLTYFIPYYGIVRMGFFVFLMAPQTKGAYTLYSSVLKPFLKTNEKEIMQFIENVKKQADEASREAASMAKDGLKEAASAENLAKGAAMVNKAQEKLDELDKQGEKPAAMEWEI